MIELDPPATLEEIAVARKQIGTSYSSIPWKTLITNLAAIGGSHYLGYVGTALAGHALGRTPIGGFLARQSPEAKQRILRTAFTGSAIGMGLLATGQQMASQNRLIESSEKDLAIYEEKVMSKVQENRARAGGAVKTASIHAVYRQAVSTR